MSTAVANGNGKKTIQQWLADPVMVEQFARALPQHMRAEMFARAALTALTRVPKLAQCTPESFMKCLFDCASYGLIPDGRRAHLIPYKDQCTLIVDYKGMVELVRRSGDVLTIHADVVCDNDEFEFDLGVIRHHRINYKHPRGKPYAAYAMVTLRDGGTQCVVLTRDEIETIRSRSRAGKDGPWVTDWNEMAKKTAFRRLCKWLTLSPEIVDVITKDDEHVGAIDVSSTPALAAQSGTDRLAALLGASPATTDDGEIITREQAADLESGCKAVGITAMDLHAWYGPDHVEALTPTQAADLRGRINERIKE